MKPATFGYHRALTVSDAIALLQEHGEWAKVIAGGQSLAPMMNFRLARPETLIDIMSIAGLGDVRVDDGHLVVGALATHHQVERLADADVPPGHRLIRDSMRWIGHLPIRTRGTVGGSIAHGDASAEWCLMAVLYDAGIVVEGPQGRRTLPAREFFHGLYSTALEYDELIVEVDFPAGFEHAALVEFAERHGDFAIVAAAVMLDIHDGAVREGRVAVCGAAPTPIRLPEAERALAGTGPVGPELARRCAEEAYAAVTPEGDANGSAEYRRHLVRNLVEAACLEAMSS